MGTNANIGIDTGRTVSVEVDTERADLDDLVVQRGWGIFKHTSGFSTLSRTQLIEVLEDKVPAQERVDELNDTQSRTEYMVTDDPESDVWYSSRFSMGGVAVSGVKIVAKATYVPVEGS